MFATLSVEKRVFDRFKQFDGLTVAALSAMSKELGHFVNATFISQGFNGIKAFTNGDGEFLEQMLMDLDNLVKATSPIPVNVKNPLVISNLIKDMKNTPNDLPTLADLILLNEILQGHELKEAAASRHLSVSELKQLLSGAAVKVQKASWHVSELLKEEQNG